MAMGITLRENDMDLTGDRLWVEDRGVAAGPIAWGPRIGIRVGTDRPWRAWVEHHPAVSARRLAPDRIA
jgi:DNA-3-methyladenine glycosylase